MRVFQMSLAIVAAIAVVWVALVIILQAKSPPVHPVDGDRLVRALARYRKDVRNRGEPLLPSVSMDALIQAGYLRTEDAQPFEGAKVIFNTQADERHPSIALMEAHMPDGEVILLLADGSVQTWSRSRYEDSRKNTGLASGPAEESLPVGSRTNQTAPAAASPP